MAKGLGIIAPATIWAVETTGEEPALVRFIWSKWERRGRPELAGAELGAAAGVWWRVGAALRCTAGAAEGLYDLLASPGAR